MKKFTLKTAVAALPITMVTVIAPYAHASEASDLGVKIQEAVATAPAQHSVGHALRNADGGSWAPGGVGAFNWLYVKGNGLKVDTASVAYVPGTNLATSNACVDEFEITYYKNGQRISETSGAKCAPVRVLHSFALYKNLDAYTSFCGRVRIGDTWGNYACINILP